MPKGLQYGPDSFQFTEAWRSCNALLKQLNTSEVLLTHGGWPPKTLDDEVRLIYHRLSVNKPLYDQSLISTLVAQTSVGACSGRMHPWAK